MDPNQPVSKRTLLDHQDFQLRDAARINARAASAAMEGYGLRAGVVRQVSLNGAVIIDDYANSDGGGNWMAVMSHTFPRPGDIAIYGLINGAPVVLGVMPDELDPYRLNSPNFTYYIEHFHFLNSSLTSGTIAPTGLFFAQGSGATINAVTSAGIGTPSMGNGWILLVTPATLGAYGFVYNGVSNISMYTLQSFEVGIYITTVGGEFLSIALDDAPVSTPTNCLRFLHDNTSNNWMVQAYNAGVAIYQTVDTGIPVQAGKLTCIRFTKLSPGVWQIHYRVPQDSAEPTDAGIFEGLSQIGNVYTSVTLYNRLAAGRSLYIDYMAWSIDGMAGVF